MENALFNEKTIKSFLSKITLSLKQKKSAKEWLNLIYRKELMKEKRSYLEFYDKILKDILGYDKFEHEKENVEFTYEKNGKSIVRIEVKGMDCKDLFARQNRTNPESPVDQLWRYMQLHATPYGIVTNYKIFILFKYSAGSLKYHLFDFESTGENLDKLKEFIAIFSKESIDNDFVEEIYEKSIVEEREFTKEFYKLYHETRLMLIKEFENNSDISRDASVHFSQLFLNRLMFIFFAEDTSKIDKRTVENRVLNMLSRNQELFSQQSKFISDLIITFFNELDKGNPPKIFGFNGGLFKSPIPPKIFFKDFRDDRFFRELRQYSKLKKEISLNENEKEIFNRFKNKLNPVIQNILLMASFDFNTEVNVNILGHIFEQSISDLEDLKKDSISRRKKEGIFYTPELITDYICRNTIITYLSNGRTNDINKLIKEYGNIQELEERFKSIKILDPACGSGAFLIKSTEIMLEVFKKIQEFKQQEGSYQQKEKGLKIKRKYKDQIVLSKWNEEDEARKIIENNIYGVDINAESVEITKLSLFLKMARNKRKLTDLSNNIKQGNSLIDDDKVAGKLAFNWKNEFPFKFDIVIGNPPYIFARESKFKEDEKSYYYNKYKLQQYQINTYILFTELGYSLLKKSGYLGFITPNNWQTIDTCFNFRKFIFDETSNIKVINSYDKTFEDANVDNGILIFKKELGGNYELIELKNKEFNVISKGKKFDSKNYIVGFTSLKNTKIQPLLDKINKISIQLEEISTLKSGLKAYEVGKGIPSQTKEMKNNRIYHTFEKKDNNFYRYLEGKDVSRYYLCWSGQYLKYGKNLAASRFFELFSSKRILVRQIPAQAPYCIHSVYVEEVCLNDINSMIIFDFKGDYNPKFILGIINSKLISFWFINTFDKLQRGLFPQFKVKELAKFPIPKNSSKEQKPFIEKVDSMIKLNKEFYEKKNRFFVLIKNECKLDKISKKLDKFYDLNSEEFIEQLGVKLNIDKKSELLKFFEKNKKEIVELKEKIDKTDKEIDELVYKIYEITEKEKKTIEESFK